MAHVVNLKKFQKILKLEIPKIEEAIVKGIQSSALRLEGMIIEEIENAKAVATSELKGSVDTQMIPKGAITGPDAPHAPFVEFGTRPHFPPLQPIIDWVKIKGISSDDDEAIEIARRIVKAIGRKGTEPRRPVGNAFDRLKADKIVEEEIHDELVEVERRIPR